MTRLEIRTAIWLAHEKRDMYTSRLIENFDDLEIDHIIPKSIDSISLADKINKYQLGGNFSINSLENLVPTHKWYNRKNPASYSMNPQKDIS